jgi:hypothetical protein
VSRSRPSGSASSSRSEHCALASRTELVAVMWFANPARTNVSKGGNAAGDRPFGQAGALRPARKACARRPTEGTPLQKRYAVKCHPILSVAVLVSLVPACGGTAPEADERVASSSQKLSPATSDWVASPTGRIEHVIYVQFDNVHFRRDNPNVPSDLEQMPNLLQFLEGTRRSSRIRPTTS